MRTASPRASVIACAALAAGAGTLALFGFGPLDPPSGPISPTYKTLSEVEPRIAINAANTPGDADSVYRIAAPGSYYLTGAFNVPSGKSGIEIAVTNATVDLNGCRLAGLNGSLDGIHANGALVGITIRNGVIDGARGDGIDAVDASAMRVEGVTVLHCGGQGITVGITNEVAHCTVVNNASHGINTGDACLVTDCAARGNGGVGIDVDNDSSVQGCIATLNVSDGISANQGCAVSGSTASGNTGNGINTGAACIVTGSIGRANGAAGITAIGGIAIVRDCLARDNTGNGIAAGDGSVVSGCAAGVNQSGIAASVGVTISGCNAYANHANGIEFGSSSDIRANNSSVNTAAGLQTAGQGSRVDMNQSTGNAIGIVLDGFSNVIHRNDLSRNGGAMTGAADDIVNWFGIEPWDNITY